MLCTRLILTRNPRDIFSCCLHSQLYRQGNGGNFQCSEGICPRSHRFSGVEFTWTCRRKSLEPRILNWSQHFPAQPPPPVRSHCLWAVTLCCSRLIFGLCLLVPYSWLRCFLFSSLNISWFFHLGWALSVSLPKLIQPHLEGKSTWKDIYIWYKLPLGQGWGQLYSPLCLQCLPRVLLDLCVASSLSLFRFLTLNRWCSTLWTSGSVWRHFVVVIIEGGAIGISWVEASDATKHHAVHKTAPTTKNHPAPSISNAEVEKFCSKETLPLRPCLVTPSKFHCPFTLPWCILVLIFYSVVLLLWTCHSIINGIFHLLIFLIVCHPLTCMPYGDRELCPFFCSLFCH